MIEELAPVANFIGICGFCLPALVSAEADLVFPLADGLADGVGGDGLDGVVGVDEEDLEAVSAVGLRMTSFEVDRGCGVWIRLPAGSLPVDVSGVEPWNFLGGSRQLGLSLGVRGGSGTGATNVAAFIVGLRG